MNAGSESKCRTCAGERLGGLLLAYAEPLSDFAAQTVRNSFPLLVYGCLIWKHLWKQVNEGREGQV